MGAVIVLFFIMVGGSKSKIGIDGGVRKKLPNLPNL